jgi:hypothetical protein
MQSQRSKTETILILFRYFTAASLMRQDFDGHLCSPKDMEWVGDDPLRFLISKAGLKMCLWYGMLYVVVEGWREAKLSDSEVDRLLASQNTELLRKFRNGMFHFQEDQWLPKKFSDFFVPTNKTVEWARALTAEFRRYLMTEMDRISHTTSTSSAV